MAFNNELTILNQYKDLIDENIIVSKTDPKGIITFANNKFCEISGYSRIFWWSFSSITLPVAKSQQQIMI